jgi:hypothetical protein
MSDFPYSRRQFLRDSALLGVTLPFWSRLSIAAGKSDSNATKNQVQVHWLEQQQPASFSGVTGAWPGRKETCRQPAHLNCKHKMASGNCKAGRSPGGRMGR